MIKKIPPTLFLVFALSSVLCAADVTPYFPPKGDATGAAVAEIHAAKKEILIQAYGFTSEPIGDALTDAVKRGVKITVVCDKSNLSARKSLAPVMQKLGVPVWVDYRPPIAHAKIMIIDQATILCGSFNWTHQAQLNSEDMNVMKHDAALVRAYTVNFKVRLSLSRPFPKEGK